MRHGFYEGDDGTLYLEWETSSGLACTVEVNPDGSEMHFVRDNTRTDELHERVFAIAEMGKPPSFDGMKAESIMAVQSQ